LCSRSRVGKSSVKYGVMDRTDGIVIEKISESWMTMFLYYFKTTVKYNEKF
jgi:hypothetical protein